MIRSILKLEYYQYIKISILCVIMCFFFVKGVSASQIQVEDVFSDISKDYQYYNELQTLYDRGMISPDESGRFNAKKLLNRDEFVGISMEVTCKKCINPDTDFGLIQEYATTTPFFDVAKTNKYFYCIAEADNKGYVKGYDRGYTCENNDSDPERRPFCVDDKITLEEAIAVVLRNSGIFTVEENRAVISQINAGEITENLADDISPRGADGGAYTFYGYFREALDFELLEYDEQGNQQTYKLLELIDNKARPGQSISKEDFLRIAYIALKTNSCVQEQKNELAIAIEKLDKTCSASDVNCEKKVFPLDEDTFDFSANVAGVCEQGINSDSGYTWKFYNIGTGTEVVKTGKYLDNYTFLEPGKWRVYLFVNDACGNTGEVYMTNIILGNLEDSTTDDGGLGLQINASPLRAGVGVERKFECLVTGGDGNYTCDWDFGDGQTGIGLSTTHNYSSAGIYNVIVTSTDGNGNTATSKVTIVVTDDENSGLAADILANPKYEKVGGEFNFTGISQGGTGNYRYIWDYGDGAKGRAKESTHVYEEPGSYEVKLTVVDSKGNRASSSVTVIVTETDGTDDSNALGVDITANPLNGSIDTIRNFEALVKGGNGNYTYEWDFGDNATTTGQSVSHLYDEGGYYTVTLTVTDGEGNIGTSTVEMGVTEEIGEMAVAIDVEPLTTVLLGEQLKFFSIVEGGNGEYTYEWDFGDGNTSDFKNPEYTYKEEGNYVVELNVADGLGAFQSTNVSIQVNETEEVLSGITVSIEANPSEANVGDTIQLNSTVTHGGPDYRYSWDFQDGNISSIDNPQHIFNTPGTYTVSLFVVDNLGRDGSTSVTVRILDSGVCIEGTDSDGDGVTDCDNNDKCPLVQGPESNQGCPILETTCNSDCSCDDGYICSTNDPLQCGVSGVCKPQRIVYNACLESGQSSLIYGNTTSCNACPCLQSLDFNAVLRNCDVIFPAITSPDSSEIYSRGQVYNIK